MAKLFTFFMNRGACKAGGLAVKAFSCSTCRVIVLDEKSVFTRWWSMCLNIETPSASTVILDEVPFSRLQLVLVFTNQMDFAIFNLSPLFVPSKTATFMMPLVCWHSDWQRLHSGPNVANVKVIVDDFVNLTVGVIWHYIDYKYKDTFIYLSFGGVCLLTYTLNRIAS